MCQLNICSWFDATSDLFLCLELKLRDRADEARLRGGDGGGGGGGEGGREAKTSSKTRPRPPRPKWQARENGCTWSGGGPAEEWFTFSIKKSLLQKKLYSWLVEHEMWRKL